MKHLNRRNFLRLAAGSSAVVAAGAAGTRDALAGSVIITEGGRDFSPITGKERKAIPSACWQCVTRCPNVAFVEDGRLVKIEGQPESTRTRGCLSIQETRIRLRKN